ncbi:hypothetical protein GGR42_001421 [Saonia flava]|uniref:Putative auto-transporter adhesin head GIN domain-containing protein n=1 Tax=Saonia flava TaxID=523696 RepID=A0A846R2A8_9FLAO|nr:DUF2807 domain-containing protein [Saonia flava]NJB70959.1 hypothetical protein [Saonia flava]
MKKETLLLLLVLASGFIYGQKKPKIKGNKNVVEIREYLPAFKAIQLNDDLDIILQKSSEESYDITADDNLIDIFKFKVEDSTLIISSFYKVTGKKKLEIKVNYKKLEAITLRDGKVLGESMISSDRFYISTFGSSKLKLNVSAGLMHVNMEGNSSGDFNIDSDSLYVSLKDKVDLNMYSVSETARFEMYKNATVKLDGTTDSLHLKLVENTNFKGEKLEVASALLNLEGSPTARVYVYKEIELISSGTSKTILSGNPKITITEFLNKSLLRKEED